jgi:hypothetical protein
MVATSISQWRHTYLGHPHRFTATHYPLRTCYYQQLGVQISSWYFARQTPAIHCIAHLIVILHAVITSSAEKLAAGCRHDISVFCTLVMIGLFILYPYPVTLYTNSIKQSPLMKLIWSRNYVSFMGPSKSLQCSQGPANGVYPEPDQSNPESDTIFLNTHFNILCTTSSHKWFYSLNINKNKSNKFESRISNSPQSNPLKLNDGECLINYLGCGVSHEAVL